MGAKIIRSISKFEDFINKDVNSAVKELRTIESDNRVHLHKLVYSDLVNRFDALIDDLLLLFCGEHNVFRKSILQEMSGETIPRREVYELFLEGEDAQAIILGKIENEVRNKYHKKGHAEKLTLLLRDGFEWSSDELTAPRVNSVGKIKSKTFRKDRRNPLQVPGYADWLYARRNSLVHGDGRNLQKKDLERLNSSYGSTLTSPINIRLDSIQSAVSFYKDICSFMKQSNP